MGSKPPLGRIIAYLAVAGAVVAAIHYRRDAVLIGFMVVPLIALATALTLGGHYRRSFGALPFLTLFGGIALGSLWGYASKKGALAHAAAAAVVAVVIGAAAYDHIYYYFQEYPKAPNAKFVFNPEAREAFEYIDSLGEPYVYYYNNRIGFIYETHRVLAPDVAGAEDRSAEFTTDPDRKTLRFDLAQSARPVIPARQQPDGAVFVLVGGYVNYLDAIQDRYPGGQVSERYNHTFRMWDYRAYYLPPDLLDSYLRSEAVEYRINPPPIP
jgi:hypothetical protein